MQSNVFIQNQNKMPKGPCSVAKRSKLDTTHRHFYIPYYVSLANMSTITGNYTNIHRNAMLISLKYRNRPSKTAEGKGMLDIFIERLKMLRNKRGLTQEAFANAINCTREAIASYETGKSTPPVEVLIQMADFLRVSLDFLVGRSQSSKIESPALVTEGEDLFSLYYKLPKDDQVRLLSIAKAFEQDFKNGQVPKD